MSITMALLLALLAFVVAGGAFGFIAFKFGVKYRMRVAESEIGTAEDQAKRILDDAAKEAETKSKEAMVEVKDEVFRLRNEAEKEIKERRSDVVQQEKRIAQKEESLDKKSENLEKREEQIHEQAKIVEEKMEQAKELQKKQMDMLEKISGLTVEQAKEQIMESLRSELAHEKAVYIHEYEQELKDTADQKARWLIGLAIARCAADHVAEATVSVVPLPSDEMKGRIIGREGRNIRSLETLTGVDLIIDDTPEAITLSCFDPVRREIARQALEKLISDGRIHPARIEETVEKCRKEVDKTIRAEGERAVLETNVRGINHELVKLLGRLKYRTSYGQNVLNHSIEVSHLSGIMAGELGVDPHLARRAGLLHDIGKALNHEIEGSHVDIGVDVCKRYKENPQIVHAIAAHHGDIEATSVLDCIVQAADAISAARPGARRENLENYIKRLEKLEEIANSFDGVDRSFAIQAGREVRIMVKPEMINDDTMPLVAREIVKRIENELNYPGQVKVNLIRESRAIEFAK